MPLDNVKHGDLGLSSRQKLLDNVSPEEAAPADDEVGFGAGHGDERCAGERTGEVTV